MNHMSRKFSNSQVEAICIAVKQACVEAGTEAFLIGAQARDLWLYPKTSSRVTKDIDWVIGASDNDTYQKVHDFLVQKEKMAQIIIRKTDETEDSNIIGLLNELEKGMQEQLE